MQGDNVTAVKDGAGTVHPARRNEIKFDGKQPYGEARPRNWAWPYKKDTATDGLVEKGSFIQRTDDPGGRLHTASGWSRSGKNEGGRGSAFDSPSTGLSST